MNEPEYVRSKIFSKIATDNRVNPELEHCLYCLIQTQSAGDFKAQNESPKGLPYKIPLKIISEFAKQCPACNRIYILKDPF